MIKPNNMEVISSGYQDVKEYICKNIPADISSNILKHFYVFQKTDYGVLRFNTFTGEFVLLTENESLEAINSISSHEYGFTANKYVDDFRNKSLKVVDLAGHICTYTIFPTTGCNARCPYCFEKGRKISNMSQETANKVVNYISKHNGGNTVNIRWFGGEPLLRFDIIKFVCNSLRNLNVKFTSSMATNGLLLKDFDMAELIAIMNLRQVQITIDGSEAVYNKVKGYISPTPNPFKQVLENIRNLSISLKTDVLIRLNISAANIDDLMVLLTSVLVPQFSSYKNIKVYTHLLNDSLSDLSQDNTDILFLKWIELEKVIENTGLSTHIEMPSNVKTHRCIVDDGNAITVLPDGNIGLCENYTTNHYIGHINKEQFDKSEIQYLRTSSLHLDICNSCVMYPQCIRLKCCPDANYCSAQLRERQIRNLQSSMLAAFQAFLSTGSKLRAKR